MRTIEELQIDRVVNIEFKHDVNRGGTIFIIKGRNTKEDMVKISGPRLKRIIKTLYLGGTYIPTSELWFDELKINGKGVKEDFRPFTEKGEQEIRKYFSHYFPMVSNETPRIMDNM